MKKKRNLIIKICSALLMVFIFVLSFTCKSYAWYLNDNGNLVSSNLFENTFNYNTVDFHVITNNQTTTISGNNNNVTFLDKAVVLEPGSYFLSVQNSTNPNNPGLSAFVEINSIRYDSSFTISTSGTYYVYLRIELSSYVNYSFNIMLNSGSSALIYEPYGIYYSSSNYIDNYNTGFENGVNSITSMFRQCSSVEQTINSVTTTFESDNNGSAFEKWFNQSNGTICSFDNGRIAINYSRLNSELGFSYGLRFYFGTFTPNTLHYDYYSFVSNVPCNIYVYCNGYSFFDSNGKLFIDNPTGYDIQSVYFYVSSANPGPTEWYLTTVDDTSSAYSSGYSQGQEVGYENGYGVGYENGVSYGSISGFNEGYEQGSSQQNLGRKLFWTIAATPFESFKTIWNVDILGLNISGIILGVLMALLVIYLIKKIWK